jgi:quinoprotein dehydrogenase-associated probable ABC transporter substrate-binding protein
MRGGLAAGSIRPVHKDGVRRPRSSFRVVASFVLALLPCALAWGTTADASRDTPPPHASQDALRVCADPNNLPFTNRAGQGFENKLAQLVARDLKEPVVYTWWPQRRGFIRNTLKAGHCDVVMGLPAGFDMAELTAPYYASTYVFVTRQGTGLGNLASLDDPRLRKLRIGLHAIGDDYANVPPAEALAARGITSNVVGYSIYGDYSKPNPPADLINAVARGEVDVAIAWGPLGGYYAARAKPALVVRPIRASAQHPEVIPLDYAIAVGVRHGDHALRDRLQQVLDRHKRDIDQLLAQYAVPRAPLSDALKNVVADED